MGKRSEDRAALTSEVVERIVPPPSGYAMLWDGGVGSVAGFGVRATSTGVKSFIYNFRTRAGRQRRLTIGRHPDLTASQARALARKAAVEVANGGDPVAVQKAARAAQGRTLAHLAKLYLEHLRERTTPPTERTLVQYQRDYLDRWLLPAFGGRAVLDIERDELKTLHRRITTESGPYLANRVLNLAHGIAKFGDASGWWPGGWHLTAAIDRNPEKARNAERAVMLTPEQLKRLLAALDDAEHQPGANPYAIMCVRFLLWSGWRPEEAFHLKWADLDLESGRARLTRTKTRQDGEERVLLTEAIAVLRSVPRVAGYPFVFCGQKPGQPLTHVNRTWRALRTDAELLDLGGNLGAMRLRDLRHSFVAQQINRGVDLGMVGKMVGHKSRASTSRYGGFAVDLLRSLGDAAQAKVRAEIAEAEAAAQAKVLPDPPETEQ